MEDIVIAIDPGAKGAAAIDYGDGVIALWNFDSESGAIQMLDYALSVGNAVACVEEVGGYVGKNQPGSAMFKFGRNFGFWLGALMSRGVPVHLVRPQVWQRGISRVAGTKGAEHKRALRDEAKRLFPEQKITLANADALLILNWFKNNKKQ